MQPPSVHSQICPHRQNQPPMHFFIFPSFHSSSVKPSNRMPQSQKSRRPPINPRYQAKLRKTNHPNTAIVSREAYSHLFLLTPCPLPSQLALCPDCIPLCICIYKARPILPPEQAKRDQRRETENEGKKRESNKHVCRAPSQLTSARPASWFG